MSGKRQESSFSQMDASERKIVPPAVTIGGHGGGVVSGVFALVEYENGEMAEVSPRKIKFLDGKEMFEARFFEENQEKREEE